MYMNFRGTVLLQFDYGIIYLKYIEIKDNLKTVNNSDIDLKRIRRDRGKCLSMEIDDETKVYLLERI